MMLNTAFLKFQMCNFLWRINGLIKHLPLNKPTHMDEK
jgi:hypothetical protein